MGSRKVANSYSGFKLRTAIRDVNIRHFRQIVCVEVLLNCYTLSCSAADVVAPPTQPSPFLIRPMQSLV